MWSYPNPVGCWASMRSSVPWNRSRPSDLYSPLSGEVVEANQALSGNEATINDDPYEGAWLIKVRVKDTAELEALLTAEGYKAEIGE
jgi:glycine cleavage system H lipoate-binding protein